MTIASITHRAGPAWAALILGSLLLAVGPALAEEADSDAEKAAEEEQEEEKSASDETPTIPIEVEAKELRVQPGHTKYGEEVLRNMPTGDGHLSDLLRLNPAVDFSRESDLSGNGATLRPDEISIHGQPFYQNLFLIDGIDTTNDLNPADAEDIWAIPSLTSPNSGSSPQGYYIDVNLLESVEVFDSNIPAEHGGFTGGVVAAELKSYEGENKYSLRFGMKRDEWEKFHADEPTRDTSSDHFNATYTPDYLKRNYSLSVQHALTEDLGLTLSASRRSSSFAQRYYDYYHAARSEWHEIEYEDKIDNVMGRLDTTWRDHKVGLSFRFARRRHDGLTGTRYDGHFEKDHDGYGLTGDFDGRVGPGQLELKLGFDELSDELDSDSNVFTYHEYAERHATDAQYEGAFGDSEQEQMRITLKPKWSMDPQQMFGGEHRVAMGGEVRYTNSFYERPSDVTFFQYFCQTDAGSQGCQDKDGDGVSSPGDEYLYRRTNYYAGKVDLHYGEWAFYVEDRMRFGDFQFNAGLRADRNSFLENVDVAPRLSAEWDVFGDNRTVLIAGANRYYGRSFMRMQLNDAIYGWRDQTIYRPNGTVLRVTDYSNRTGVSDLDTPYSDEWMVGWTQAAGPIQTRLQFVKREGRDGITRRYEDQDGERGSEYYYTNEGRSSTKSATLDITNEKVLKIGPTETTLTLALNYKDTDNNNQSDAGYDEQIEEEIIYYNGRLITYDKLPAWDYNIPFGTRLFWTTKVPSWDLTWSNFVNWRRGGTTASDSRKDYCPDGEIKTTRAVWQRDNQNNYVLDPDGNRVLDPQQSVLCSDGTYNSTSSHPKAAVLIDVYEDFDFKSAVTLDTELLWKPTYAGQTFFVKAEINNVFDKKVNRSRTSTTYSRGRVFWLEVGIEF